MTAPAPLAQNKVEGIRDIVYGPEFHKRFIDAKSLSDLGDRYREQEKKRSFFESRVSFPIIFRRDSPDMRRMS